VPAGNWQAISNCCGLILKLKAQPITRSLAVEDITQKRVYILVRDTESEYGTDVYKINDCRYVALAISADLKDVAELGHFGARIYELVYYSLLNQTALGKFTVVRPLFFNDFHDFP
jgi:hypothetical protein